MQQHRKFGNAARSRRLKTDPVSCISHTESSWTNVVSPGNVYNMVQPVIGDVSQQTAKFIPNIQKVRTGHKPLHTIHGIKGKLWKNEFSNCSCLQPPYQTSNHFKTYLLHNSQYLYLYVIYLMTSSAVQAI
jgi:hypothetical protein